MSDEELTAEQKRQLFEAYENCRAKAAKATAQLDATVRAIADQIGTGPFRWQGSELSIVRRGERVMMRANGSQVEEIG